MRLICVILIISVGLFLLTLGIVLWFVIPIVVKQKINALLPLPNKTIVYDEWRNTSLPIYMQFWFFSVVNKAELEAGEKPFLQQVGPYTYREYRIKENITFYPNGSVSYRQRRQFFFDRNQSVGDENDMITTVNIPLVVIGDMLRGWGFIEHLVDGVVEKLGDTDVMMNVSVGNITWGYVDPVLKMISEMVAIFNIKLNPIVGLFYGKNDTDDGLYLVDSGASSLDSFLSVRRWRGSENLAIWNDIGANMINGTDGSMFPPFLASKSDTTPLYVFQSDICRSIYAVHTSSPKIHGIPSRTYTPPYAVFADHKENPSNYGFCVDGKCLGSGVLNLSSCIAGMPVVMSQPHLYQAAAIYQKNISGLHPSPDCITSLSIEPTTGLPLDLQKKLQINIAIDPVPGFKTMGRLRKLLLPVMWLNESVKIDDHLASVLTTMLIIPVKAATGVAIGLFVLGSFVVAVVLICILMKFRRRSSYVNLNSSEIPS